MAISKQTKQEIVQRLLVTKQKGHNLEITLRFKGKTEDADQVVEKTAELTSQIDILLGQIIDEWLDQSARVVEDIRRTNAKLQGSVRAITRGVEIAQMWLRRLGL